MSGKNPFQMSIGVGIKEEFEENNLLKKLPGRTDEEKAWSMGYLVTFDSNSRESFKETETIIKDIREPPNAFGVPFKEEANPLYLVCVLQEQEQ